MMLHTVKVMMIPAGLSLSTIQGTIVWIASLVVPVMADDTFYGITGVDMGLDFIQALVEQLNETLHFSTLTTTRLILTARHC